MIRTSPFAALVFALLAPISVARAEVFVLNSGGEVSGRWLNRDEQPLTRYVIQLGARGRIVLPAAEVKEVVDSDPAEAEYRRIQPGFADTAEQQWALAEWCREHDLHAEREKHLRRAVALDPDHVEARRALGYAKYDGEWRTPDEVMTERGYVRYKGRWRTPQEVQLMERDRKLEVARKQWYVDIRRWRDWLDGKRAAEGRRNLLAIDDPLAVPGLSDILADEPVPQARMIFIEALARIGTPAAMQVLARGAMEDPVEEVRLTCLDYLKKQPSPEVAGYFIGKLRSKDNKMVNRAAVALGQLESPTAISPLIDALITEHKFKLVTAGSGGSMSATFPTGGSGGGGGLSMNQKPKIIKRLFQNQAVLDALVEITGQNFNYNQQAWKYWLASQRRRVDFDPRRD